MRERPERSRLYEIIGKKVRDLRTERGMTQERLAKAVRTARTSITNLEQGNQAVPLHQLFAIAEALDTEISQLLPTRAEVGGPEPAAPVRISGMPSPPPRQTAHLITTLLAEPEEGEHG